MERQRGNAYGNIQSKDSSRSIIGDFNDSSKNPTNRSRTFHRIYSDNNSARNSRITSGDLFASVHNTIGRSPELPAGPYLPSIADRTLQQPRRPIFVTTLQANFFRPANHRRFTTVNDHMSEYVRSPTLADRRRNSDIVLSLDRRTVSNILIEAAGHYPSVSRRIATAGRARGFHAGRKYEIQVDGDGDMTSDSDGDGDSDSDSDNDGENDIDSGSDSDSNSDSLRGNESQGSSYSASIEFHHSVRTMSSEEDEEERLRLRVFLKAWYRQKIVGGVTISLRAAEYMTRAVLERI